MFVYWSIVDLQYYITLVVQHSDLIFFIDYSPQKSLWNIIYVTCADFSNSFYIIFLMSSSHDILIQSSEGRRDKQGKWMTLRMFLACWTQVSLSILLTKICYMPHLPSREAGKHIYTQRPYTLLKIRLLLLGNQKKRKNNKKKKLLGQTRADASFSHIAHIPYSPRKSHDSSL